METFITYTSFLNLLVSIGHYQLSAYISLRIYDFLYNVTYVDLPSTELDLTDIPYTHFFNDGCNFSKVTLCHSYSSLFKK